MYSGNVFGNVVGSIQKCAFPNVHNINLQFYNKCTKIHFNPVRHSTVIITIDQLLLWWLFAEMLLFSQCSLDGGRTEQRT